MLALPPLPPLVGRSTELAELARLLADPDCRLLTLVGLGGAGKTRLAIQAAAQSAADFPDGVSFVPLEMVPTSEALAPAIAAALGLSATGQVGPAEILTAYLRDKRLLLVLDNFEHLLDPADGDEGAPALVGRLAASAPQAKLLVTSRRVLNLHAEWRFPVTGLRFPEPGADDADVAEFPAIQLFGQRARQMQPGFHLASLPETERAAVVRLCQLVEGLPLALELAAAWTRTLSCTAIAAEIEQRLDLLASNARDVPARQRSLLAVFEHTWERLAASDQNALRRLSVMRGSFSREAAEVVAGASLPALARLADQALLRATGDNRFHLHELLRQFAGQRLAEQPELTQAAHTAQARYFAAFIAARRPRIDSAEQPTLFREIDPDFENVRAAWEWLAANGEWVHLRAMAYVVFNYLDLRGRYTDAQQFWAAAYERLRQAPPGAERDLALAEVAVMLGWALVRRGMPGQAREAFDLALDQYARHGAVPPAGVGTEPHTGLSVVASVEGDYAAAIRHAQTAQHLSETRGDRVNLALAWYALSSAEYGRGHNADARRSAEQALRLAEAEGIPWFSAYCHNTLGQVARTEQDYARARDHFRASEAIRREVGDPEGNAAALREQGAVAELQGEHGQARELLEASLRLYRQIGDRGGLAAALSWLGRVALAQARADEARAHFAEALRVASDAHYVPVMLAALAGAGEWLGATGQEERSQYWLRYALAHPACDRETRDRIGRRLRPVAKGEAMPQRLQEAVEAALADLTVQRAAPSAPDSAPNLLNARELEVLQLIATGLTNREIAARLIMSPGTIKWYTSQIYNKLQVRGRTQALARARELRLLA